MSVTTIQDEEFNGVATLEKPVVYYSLGNTRHLDHLQQKVENKFSHSLIRELGKEYEMVEAVVCERDGYFEWHPSIPCDALVIVPVFHFRQDAIFWASEAISRFGREKHTIPVYECRFLDSNPDLLKVKAADGFHIVCQYLDSPVNAAQEIIDDEIRDVANTVRRRVKAQFESFNIVSKVLLPSL